jgi:hypothetical protein
MSDAAVAAIIGAGVGALAATGGQSTLNRQERIGKSRAACRVMLADLLEARDTLGAALEEGEWARRRTFAPMVAAWHRHRDAVSRAMGSQDFHDVAGAFKSLERLQVIRETNADAPDQGFAHAHDSALATMPKLETAHLILSRSGCTFLERWVTIRPHVLATREFEVAKPLENP